MIEAYSTHLHNWFDLEGGSYMSLTMTIYDMGKGNGWMTFRVGDFATSLVGGGSFSLTESTMERAYLKIYWRQVVEALKNYRLSLDLPSLAWAAGAGLDVQSVLEVING